MSKFNVGDKVKIPKTKKGKQNYNYDSFVKEINKKKYPYLVIDKINNDFIRLKGPDYSYLGMDVFDESDLELYEEKYTIEQLIDNKLAVVCKTKEEALKLAIKIKPSNHSFDFYGSGGYVVLPSNNGTTYGFEWTNGGSDLNYLVSNGYATKNVDFSQIDFEEETKTNNNMKLKRFKLVKTEYEKAYLALTGLLNNSGGFAEGSGVWDNLKTAGVLDLWCEEVPDTIKIHGYEVKKHNGGYKIGCKFITFQQLQNLKDFIEGNEFSDVSFGSYHITLGEIKQILAL